MASSYPNFSSSTSDWTTRVVPTLLAIIAAGVCVLIGLGIARSSASVGAPPSATSTVLAVPPHDVGAIVPIIAINPADLTAGMSVDLLWNSSLGYGTLSAGSVVGRDLRVLAGPATISTTGNETIEVATTPSEAASLLRDSATGPLGVVVNPHALSLPKTLPYPSTVIPNSVPPIRRIPAPAHPRTSRSQASRH